MAVPPRWLKCPRKSLVIADRFIAFKTPLGPRYDDQVPEAYRFQVPMLVSYLQALKVKVGLIIDLTNTNRFYDKTELEQHGINHTKLQCRGHAETPTQDQIQLFMSICDRYWSKHPGEVIGVHCTHGFNRTGFLIISYLIERLDWSLEAAIECFSKSRVPGIYKQDYLGELCTRYGDESDNIPAPERPEWCFEDEGLSDKDEEEDEEDDVGNNRDPRRKRRRINGRNTKDCKFVEGVSGVEAVQSPRCEEVQKICAQMIGWEMRGFPGSQPVSMDTKNLKFIQEKDYRLSWKADGTRYMLMILKEGEIYLIDRNNDVFTAPQFRFPQRKNPKEHVFDTLVDGEMVMDKEGDKTHPRYLAYDIIKFQGQDVGKTCHDTRMVCIHKELEQPRSNAVQQGLLDKTQEPFSIRAKQFFPVEKTRWVLEHWVTKLSHENDGLIFNPANEPYMGGNQFDVLKWKPHTLNSVDFMLKIVRDRREGCLPQDCGYLYVSGFERPFAQIKVTKQLKIWNNRIIECTWDGRQWVFLRVREDKNFPNAYKTAMSVCESIRDPVTKDMLLDVIEKHRYNLHKENRKHDQQHHQQQQQQPQNDQPQHDQPQHDQPQHDQPQHDQPQHDQPQNDQPQHTNHPTTQSSS